MPLYTNTCKIDVYKVFQEFFNIHSGILLYLSLFVFEPIATFDGPTSNLIGDEFSTSVHNLPHPFTQKCLRRMSRVQYMPKYYVSIISIVYSTRTYTAYNYLNGVLHVIIIN